MIGFSAIVSLRLILALSQSEVVINRGHLHMVEFLANARVAGALMRRRNLLFFARVLAIILAILWISGLARFASSIPDCVADSESFTDAIVILTGGSERIDTGLSLLLNNKAHRVFISGVNPSVSIEKIVEMSGKSGEEMGARIESGYSALDTAGNAAESAEWMRKKGYRSLRLVTSSYHMPRSLLEFERALPDVKIIPHPVFSHRVRRERWWASPGTVSLIVGEYNKYLLTLFAGPFSAGSAFAERSTAASIQ